MFVGRVDDPADLGAPKSRIEPRVILEHRVERRRRRARAIALRTRSLVRDQRDPAKVRKIEGNTAKIRCLDGHAIVALQEQLKEAREHDAVLNPATAYGFVEVHKSSVGEASKVPASEVVLGPISDGVVQAILRLLPTGPRQCQVGRPIANHAVYLGYVGGLGIGRAGDGTNRAGHNKMQKQPRFPAYGKGHS